MEDRYYSLNQYLHEKFGEKVYKIAIDLGLTCPNRDGTLDTRGCIFCHNGSSHFAGRCNSVSESIEKAKALIAEKTKAKRFIAYFQSYTNTYASVEYLENAFTEAMNREDVVALSIATRPDCLPEDVVLLLEKLNKIKPVWVELGLQTANEATAKYIRRCYTNDVYTDAVKRLASVNIEVITHIILGLPNEDVGDALKTVSFVVQSGSKGVKLQLLHVLKGTDLYEDYQKGLFKTLTLEEYMETLFACITHLPTDVVVHRLTGDAPKAYLAAPLWSADKKTVINTINREMIKRDIRQGSEL
ncbi:MAG: TIGR01212 family radical SAM protein [Clostridia bacterium]|nr:TIGR01212 family radical SAM protein [Clostridia bacterium]